MWNVNEHEIRTINFFSASINLRFFSDLWLRSRLEKVRLFLPFLYAEKLYIKIETSMNLVFVCFLHFEYLKKWTMLKDGFEMK